MKILIPLAGYGTRLRPHTFTKPKPLINVAGKPVLGHVLDELRTLDQVDETIFITGYLGEQIEAYVSREYPGLKARYVEQKVLDGQSTAIQLARDYLYGPLLIVFVDTLVETDLSRLQEEEADAVAWVKEVEDPRRFGVAVLGVNGYVSRLIEKPADLSHNLAVVGFYYFKDAAALLAAIQDQVERGLMLTGEYFLADAVNLMLEKGLRMRVQPVEVWEDCGKPETVLHTNEYLLSHGRDNSAQVRAGSFVVIPPVYIDPSAEIAHSVIGPYATISAGCKVERAIIRNSIIDEGAVIQDAMLDQSMIGREAHVQGRYRAFNVGDSSEVGFS